MKKSFAIMLIIVMLFTLAATAACQSATVKLVLYVTDDDVRVCIHRIGDDDLPSVSNGDKEFGGWYLDKEYLRKFDCKDKVDDGAKLYAKWNNKDETPSVTEKITVTFNPNYEGALISTQRIDKGTAVSLSVPERKDYTFDGWYTQPVGGNKWESNLTFSVDTVLYAHWTKKSSSGEDKPSVHTHDFGESYFIYVKCSAEGCNVMGRAQSTSPFRNEFTFSYTQQDRNAMDNLYATISNKVKAGSVNVSEIINGVEQFELLLDNIEYQYQVATVMFSVNYNDAWEQNSTLIGNAYNDWFKDYYTLFASINSSSYSSAFFADWTEADKEYVLSMAEIYSSSEDNLLTVADSLANEYNKLLMSGTATAEQIYAAYGNYVQANNNIAAQYGNKYSNYMDYAYENSYNREYTPADVAVMREYVRSSIAPILTDTVNKLQQIGELDDANYNFYDALSLTSLFTMDEGFEENFYAVTQYIGNYFKYLNSNSGSKKIDFYNHVNELFKNGNYFVGTNAEEGAYTYWIPNKTQSVLYFDDTYYIDEDDGGDGQYYYSTAFTFVHEFGHYYNGIYNGGMSLSMDHDETQSQGNEMLFLAWLNKNLPSGIVNGYTALMYEQLANILQTIVQSTIVDEFEQAVYSNSYGTGKFKDGINSADYGELYDTIVNSYGSGMSQMLGSTYWMNVVVDSSAYYISYAMSALPSLEIFVKAMDGGLDAARDSFLKLYTFSDSTSLTNNYSYQSVLEYAGLNSPFDEQMYTKISAFFAS